MNATHTKALGAAAALLAVPALSACGPNFNAQTDQVYTPADGENHYASSVDVLNVMIISGEPGTGRLIAGLANNTDTADEITGVSGEGDDQGVTFSLEGGDTEIPAEGLLQLADSGAANIVAEGDEELVRPGAFVRLTISFENADDATINVPVLAPGEDYEDVELPSNAESPTGSPTESPTESPTGSPTEESTESPADESTEG